MLGHAKRLKVNIFQASTSKVYGDPTAHPQREDCWGHVNAIGLGSCYDEGKRCAETLFFDYWRQQWFDIEVARIFNTYGPRTYPNDGRVVSTFIMEALTNQQISVFGDGSQTKSYCYVDNLIGGFRRLLDSPSSTDRHNVGNPSEFAIFDLAGKVIDLTGSQSKIIHRPLPEDDPRQRRPDIEYAHKVLGWSPTINLEEGLRRTIPYFESLLAERVIKTMAPSRSRISGVGDR